MYYILNPVCSEKNGRIVRNIEKRTLVNEKKIWFYIFIFSYCFSLNIARKILSSAKSRIILENLAGETSVCCLFCDYTFEKKHENFKNFTIKKIEFFIWWNKWHFNWSFYCSSLYLLVSAYHWYYCYENFCN